jgi:hypothetical protein
MIIVNVIVGILNISTLVIYLPTNPQVKSYDLLSFHLWSISGPDHTCPVTVIQTYSLPI